MNVHALNPPLLNPFGLNPISGLGYSPFGGPVPLGGFGAPYTIGLRPPMGLFNYTATGQSQLSFSLKDQAGKLVSVGTATDTKGATVITAALNTTKGSIIGFQSAPPSGLTLTGRPPAHPTVLPTVADSAGKAVPTSVSYDQYGGAVLQIQLNDVNGRSTRWAIRSAAGRRRTPRRPSPTSRVSRSGSASRPTSTAMRSRSRP
jgi:hypothetical protein